MTMPGKKKDGKEDDLHELSDIQTKEVSIVDRAANKRRFLVVKREEENMPKTQNVSKADPTAVQTGGVPGSESNTVPSAATGVDSALYGNKTLSIEGENVPAPVNSAEVRGLNEDTTGATLTAFPSAEPIATVKITDQAPSAGGFSSNTVTQMNVVMKSLGALAELEDSAAVKTGIAKACEELSKVSGEFVELEKKGAKMAKTRLEAMEKAVEALSKLVKEIKGMGVAENDDTGARKNPDGTAASSGVSKTEVAKASMPAFPPEIQVTLNEMNENLQKMAEGFAGITRVVKAQGAELQKVSKSVMGSNADPVEIGGAPEEIEWPMDLANEPNKAAVKKRGIDFMNQ